MGTKFNFKSSVCTDKNQSERLLALGLKKETADCFLLLVGDLGGPDLYTIRFGTPYEGWTEGVIPAWSLHRLIEMMGANNIQHWLGLNVERDFDLIIDTIEELIKEGYFNKEYLV